MSIVDGSVLNGADAINHASTAHDLSAAKGAKLAKQADHLSHDLDEEEEKDVQDIQSNEKIDTWGYAFRKSGTKVLKGALIFTAFTGLMALCIGATSMLAEVPGLSFLSGPLPIIGDLVKGTGAANLLTWGGVVSSALTGGLWIAGNEAVKRYNVAVEHNKHVELLENVRGRLGWGKAKEQEIEQALEQEERSTRRIGELGLAGSTVVGSFPGAVGYIEPVLLLEQPTEQASQRPGFLEEIIAKGPQENARQGLATRLAEQQQNYSGVNV